MDCICLLMGPLGMVLFVYLLFWKRVRPTIKVIPVRGKLRLDPAPDASEVTDAIDLAGIPVDMHLFTLSCLFIGLPECGKTVCVQRARATYYRSKNRVREVVLDMKNGEYPFVDRFLPKNRPVYMMNVFDTHPAVVSLNLAETFTNPALHLRLGYVLIPDTKGSTQPFFNDAARILLVALLLVLHAGRKKARRAWRLRDLLAACANQELLELILATHEGASDKFNQVMNRGKASGDVFSTLHACLSKYEPYAIADYQVKRQVSIREFMAGLGVMILGVDPQLQKVQLPLYQLLLLLVTEATLSRQDPDDYTVLSLDEVAMFEGIADVIVSAAAIGRSSQLCILAATQSSALLREKLGDNNAKAVESIAQTTVYFRVGSAEEGRTAADRLGQYEAIEWKPTEGKDVSWSASFIERYLVHPQDIMNQPLADPVADTMSCCVASSTLGSLVVKGSLLGDLKGHPRTPYAYNARDQSDSYLPRFTEEDCVALGIPLTDELLAYFAKRK